MNVPNKIVYEIKNDGIRFSDERIISSQHNDILENMQSSADCFARQPVDKELIPANNLSSSYSTSQDHRYVRCINTQISMKTYLNNIEFPSFADDIQIKLNVIAKLIRLIQFLKENVNSDIAIIPKDISSIRTTWYNRNKSSYNDFIKCKDMAIRKKDYHQNKLKNISYSRSSFTRQSLNLYTASGFLFLLCCLIIPSSKASNDALHPM